MYVQYYTMKHGNYFFSHIYMYEDNNDNFF